MEIDNLPIISTSGIAVDIDETLSWTVGYVMEQMQKLFGNPENISVREMVAKYRYTQNVPYWQSEDALRWTKENRMSNELQRALPLIENADIYLHEIHKIVPVAAYITMRPQAVLEGTADWLRGHTFPEAPIICMPDNIKFEEGIAWKGTLLGKLYPAVKGIIDDNAGLLKHLPADYEGIIFVYDHAQIDSLLNAVPCKDWQAVYEEIRKRF
ncbi:MAG TPA: hypothetical protein HA362_01580 [Nanoarchaeota archaeon]|nr:hypothetical protein [Nanoarchaeota archaeon]